jgi:hypothetical protein
MSPFGEDKDQDSRIPCTVMFIELIEFDVAPSFRLEGHLKILLRATLTCAWKDLVARHESRQRTKMFSLFH